jgi:hypothetical protein
MGRLTRSARLLPGLALVALALVPLTPHALTAQDDSAASAAASAPPKAMTTIDISFEPSRVDGIPHYLAARLVADDGSAVVGERVTIRRTADVFGGRTVTIGRATTDNAGVARVAVTPREQVYRVGASFAGSEAYEATDVDDDIVFPPETVVIPAEAPKGGIVDPQLRPLADIMPVAIGSAVLVVWVVLIGVSIVTLVRIRSSRRDLRPASEQVSAVTPDTKSGSQGG